MSATKHLLHGAPGIDVRLPDGSGLDLAARLTAVHPRLAVVVISACHENAFHRLAEAAGACGFVPKSLIARFDFATFL
jgi:DNA-binding NarL/FixJ family response regulator